MHNPRFQSLCKYHAKCRYNSKCFTGNNGQDSISCLYNPKGNGLDGKVGDAWVFITKKPLSLKVNVVQQGVSCFTRNVQSESEGLSRN